MPRKAPVQLPLRRAYLLIQAREIRGLVIIILHVERGWSYTKIGKFLGISAATAWRYAQDCLDYEWLSEDVEVARTVLNAMSTPLYATHW